MRIRRQSGVPSGAPHVGDDELLLDEATGRLYRSPTAGGVPEPITHPPSAIGGGDARGQDAIDLQYTRTVPSEVASGAQAFIAGGKNNRASGAQSHAAGLGNHAAGNQSSVFGRDNTVLGVQSHVEGNNNGVASAFSHAEGYYSFVGRAFDADLYLDSTRTIQISATTPFTAGSFWVGEEMILRWGSEELYYVVEVESIDVGTQTVVITQALGFATMEDGLVLITPAAGDWSHVEGNASIASGSASHAEGQSTRAMGAGSHAEGSSTKALGRHSHAEGQLSVARLWGQHAKASHYFGTAGDAQYSNLVLQNRTTDASATELFLDSFVERITLEDDKLYNVRALVVGKRQGTDENAAYELKGVFKRGTGAASVALLGAVVKAVLHEDVVGWDVAMSADGVNGSIRLRLRGRLVRRYGGLRLWRWWRWGFRLFGGSWFDSGVLV